MKDKISKRIDLLEYELTDDKLIDSGRFYVNKEIEFLTDLLILCEVSISATEKAELISSLSYLLVNNKNVGLYTQLQTDCVNKLELLVSSIEL